MLTIRSPHFSDLYSLSECTAIVGSGSKSLPLEYGKPVLEELVQIEVREHADALPHGHFASSGE